MTWTIIDISRTKPCPECGEKLYYFVSLKGWSHQHFGPDWDDKECHYNEGAK